MSADAANACERDLKRFDDLTARFVALIGP